MRRKIKRTFSTFCSFFWFPSFIFVTLSSHNSWPPPSHPPNPNFFTTCLDRLTFLFVVGRRCFRGSDHFVSWPLPNPSLLPHVWIAFSFCGVAASLSFVVGRRCLSGSDHFVKLSSFYFWLSPPFRIVSHDLIVSFIFGVLALL